jgi:hypothetical protein
MNIYKLLKHIIKQEVKSDYGRRNLISVILLIIVGISLCTTSWIVTLITSTEDTIKTVALHENISTQQNLPNTNIVFIVIALWTIGCFIYVGIHEKNIGNC